MVLKYLNANGTWSSIDISSGLTVESETTNYITTKVKDTTYNLSKDGHTHSNYSTTTHTHPYLPLAGGTLTGDLNTRNVFIGSSYNFVNYGYAGSNPIFTRGIKGIEATAPLTTSHLYLNYGESYRVYFHNTNNYWEPNSLNAVAISENGTLLSSKYAPISHEHSNYLKLTGGMITGELSIDGGLTVDGVVANTSLIGKTPIYAVRSNGNNGVGDLYWVNNADGDSKIPTLSTIAYWNGAYAGSSSNLTYCRLGAFGAAAVRGVDTTPTASSTNLVTSGGIHSAINTAVANLVSSSPEALDTLNELATALGNDPNFATTVSNQIGTKLSTSGGTISGNLTVSGTITEGTTKLSEKYAPISHTHSNYAASSHTHSGYALTSHTHSGYAASSHTHSYLPLTGGTVSGNLTVTGTILSSSGRVDNDLTIGKNLYSNLCQTNELYVAGYGYLEGGLTVEGTLDAYYGANIDGTTLTDALIVNDNISEGGTLLSNKYMQKANFSLSGTTLTITI